MVKVSSRCALWAAALLLPGLATADDQRTGEPARSRIEVADLVREAIVGDPMSLTFDDSRAKVSSTSPDGKLIAVVLRHGDPDRQVNEASLLIYRSADLLGSAQARVLATLATSTSYQPIALVRWLDDSNTLIFAGAEGSAEPQLYRADVLKGTFARLAEIKPGFQWYDVTPSGERLVTLYEPAVRRPDDDPSCQASGCLVTAEGFYAAQQGFADVSSPIYVHAVGKGVLNAIAPAEQSDADLEGCGSELKGGISPDGRYALQICKIRRDRWPAWWRDYTVHPEIRETLSRGMNGYVRQWVIHDLERGTTRRLTSAPYAMRHYGGTSPQWIDGGRRVLIPGALEPLTNATSDERKQRASHYVVLEFEPVTGQSRRVITLPADLFWIEGASWDDRAQTLSMKYVKRSDMAAKAELTYQRNGRAWKEVPGMAPVTAAARLEIRQSLNEPPVLFAVDAVSGRERKLLDLNPWLTTKQLGKVESITWQSKDGRSWSGGIYYPPGYQTGVRYPAVLQTHGFDEHRFSLYGAARNFAAQALAARDILVLQIAENTRDAFGVDEWRAAQAGYEAAVDHLDQLGLIDRSRVGIHGWSRTGPYMGYTLTQSSYRFAAGVFTETADYGWWYVMLRGARPLSGSPYDASPFGPGLDAWRAMAPSFNLDRVNTPMLMSGEVASVWDWYVGLRQLGKPVEYWALPNPSHDVFKASHRLAMNQRVVDWFGFWLKGEEDAKPEKSAQYERWRALRGKELTQLSQARQRERAN
jgi:hypothetical protein